MCRFLIAIFLLLLPVHEVRADQPEQERIYKLFEVTGVVQQTELVVTQMLPIVLTQIGPPIRRAARAQNRQIPADFDTLLKAEAERIFSEMGIEILVALVPVYTKAFTAKEVEQMIAFYDTDLGRRLVVAAQRMGPTAAKIGAQVGAVKGKELVDSVLARLPKADESLN